MSLKTLKFTENRKPKLNKTYSPLKKSLKFMHLSSLWLSVH